MRTRPRTRPDVERALRAARRLLKLVRAVPGVEERRLTQLALLVTDLTVLAEPHPGPAAKVNRDATSPRGRSRVKLFRKR
jgi:hypothetical protein